MKTGDMIQNIHDGMLCKIRIVVIDNPEMFSCEVIDGKNILPKGFIRIQCHESNWRLIK